MATNSLLSSYDTLFGESLIKCSLLKETNDSEVNSLVKTIDILKDESLIIGIYFSFVNNISNEFTKSLVNLYERINETGDCDKFQVIQVVLYSPTTNLTPNDIFNICKDCVVDLPWFAIPFSEFEKKSRLIRRYNVAIGVPTLILLNSDLTIITSMGRERLLEDPEGVHFPWRPRPVTQILQNLQLLKGGFWDISHCDGKDTLYLKFGNNLVWAFYFSANWCPPCRAFTPQLVNTYQQIRKRGQQFEIIFVSSDRSLESFNIYTETMPWLAVPYECEDIRKELTSAFGVQGIPKLIMLDVEGQIITEDGRSEVLDDPDGLNFPWKPRLINILTERYATKMHDFPAIVIFIEGEENEIEFAENVLKPVAETYYNDHNLAAEDEHSSCKHKNRCLQFLIGIDSDTSDILREFVGLDDAIPLLAAIDIPNRKYAYLEYGIEITETSVDNFVKQFLNNSLEMRDIRLHNKVTEKNEKH